MIGIYNDSFLKYLKQNDFQPKITSKNIVIRCPWCEMDQEKDHYHMYISLEAPIFHCFHGSCERGGTLRKLIKKIKGVDVSDSFVDKSRIVDYQKTQQLLKEKDKDEYVKVPKLNTDRFKYKDFYMRKRLKFFNINTEHIKGLVYDIDEFLNVNQVPIDETLFRLRDYLHSNFIGFLTEHNTTLICRNVDSSHSMRYFKIKLHDSHFTDYYKLLGRNINSNTIVLAEGIFDIFAEQIYDSLNIQSDVALYASALSANYTAVIRSIVYHEQIFRPDVVILSDRGIDMPRYEKMYYFNRHVINSLVLYYNMTGKDFNDVPIAPRRVIVNGKGANKNGRRYKDRKIKRNF
jgi:hypothetical protein